MRSLFEKTEANFDDPTRVPISVVAQNLSRLIDQVRRTKQRLIITKNGRASVAISPLREVALVDTVINKEGKG